MWLLHLPLTFGLVIYQGTRYYGEAAVEIIVTTPTHELGNINVDWITKQELAELPRFIRAHLALKPVIQPSLTYSYSFSSTFKVKNFESYAPFFSKFAIQVHQLSSLKVNMPSPIGPFKSVAKFDFVKDESLSIADCFEERSFNFDYDFRVRSSPGVDARLAAWNLLHGIYGLPDNPIYTEWALIVLVFQDASLSGDLKLFIEWLCSIPLDFAIMLNTSKKNLSRRSIKLAASSNPTLWSELLQLAIQRIGTASIIPKLEEWRKGKDPEYTVRESNNWESVAIMHSEWRVMKERLRSSIKQKRKSRKPCKLKVSASKVEERDDTLPDEPYWLDDDKRFGF